jgi:hypothetical protein
VHAALRGIPGIPDKILYRKTLLMGSARPCSLLDAAGASFIGDVMAGVEGRWKPGRCRRGYLRIDLLGPLERGPLKDPVWYELSSPNEGSLGFASRDLYS